MCRELAVQCRQFGRLRDRPPNTLATRHAHPVPSATSPQAGSCDLRLRGRRIPGLRSLGAAREVGRPGHRRIPRRVTRILTISRASRRRRGSLDQIAGRTMRAISTA
jgi:hypothetical protein